MLPMFYVSSHPVTARLDTRPNSTGPRLTTGLWVWTLLLFWGASLLGCTTDFSVTDDSGPDGDTDTDADMDTDTDSDTDTDTDTDRGRLVRSGLAPPQGNCYRQRQGGRFAGRFSGADQSRRGCRAGPWSPSRGTGHPLPDPATVGGPLPDGL